MKKKMTREALGLVQKQPFPPLSLGTLTFLPLDQKIDTFQLSSLLKPVANLNSLPPSFIFLNSLMAILNSPLSLFLTQSRLSFLFTVEEVANLTPKTQFFFSQLKLHAANPSSCFLVAFYRQGTRETSRELHG